MSAFDSANRWALSLQFPSDPCPHQQRATEELWRIIEPLGISTVLDVGAGESAGAMSLMLKGHGIEVQAVDALATGVRRADAHELPYPDNSADLVVARHVMEHVLSPYVVLREMMRVSRKWLLVVVPEDIPRWRYWGGHLNVLPYQTWEFMFWLLRLHIPICEVGDFSEQAGAATDLEWRWLLVKDVLKPITGYEWNGHYPGPYPEEKEFA